MTPMRRYLSIAAVSALAGLVWQGPALAGAEAESASTLEEKFQDPPNEARPRVWWHWLNGNVSQDGIAKDLAWLAHTGIGGVQTFDVNFQTPDVVDQRLSYMTPQWKDAFRFATQETERLDLELTVASSPGWSLTGGPWVAPADGMKKLVWSETTVAGGVGEPVHLAPPPHVSGPFQDIPLKPEPGADPNHVTPEFYRDVAVLAFRIPAPPTLPRPTYTLHDGSTLDAALLTDGALADGVEINRTKEFGASITMSFDAPQTVRSLAAYLPGTADMFSGPALDMVLERRTGEADWQEVAHFQPTLAPSTIGFDPVTASEFRLRMTSIDTLSPIDLMSAPGYAGMNYSIYLRQMPFKVAELRLSGEQKLDQFETKAGFGIARDYYALQASAPAGEQGIAPSDVLDLTQHLQPDGTLGWSPPKGNWRILRMGYSLTGKTNHPAPAEATGLEVDKLDGAAVRRYMEGYIASYRDAVGPDLIGENGINAILTDSTEIGAFNWTPDMVEQFERLRGYDPTPWLPTLAGAVIGTRAQSDRFLYDFRRTIAELHASQHYGTVAEVAHEAGLKVYGEALEGWRVSLGDDIDMRSHTDIPMAAMWAFPKGVGARPLLEADIRTAASSAHLRGKPYVAAESMTSSRFPWAMGPAELRRVVDTEFAHGVNRIIVHTSPHQPVDDKRPGLSLRHIGQFFTRHETWADMAKPWVDYLARSSFLLQQGRFAADVAYFPGEEAPAPTLVGEGVLDDLPKRHAYDYVNAFAILNDLSVEDGEIVSQGGARYKALYLGGTSERMTLPVLQRLHQLARDGATIVGMKPEASPSLADSEKAFRKLAAKMWRGAGKRKLGAGRVIAGKDIDAALAMIGIAPQVSFTDGADAIDFVERQLPDGTIYYLRNSSDSARSVEAFFRVTGKEPERWDAVTGRVTPLGYAIRDGQTRVPLELGPEESLFVVFRNEAREQTRILPAPATTQLAALDGTWSVTFEEGRGAPSGIELPGLAPLNEQVEPGVRYFSGVATYRKSFELARGTKAEDAIMIDLGPVGDIAEVWVNGALAGTAWQAPYRVDISQHVRPGHNEVEIRVANLWVNRLIGDAQPGAEQIGWTSVPMYKADAPLRPAGLIGPVRIIAIE